MRVCETKRARPAAAPPPPPPATFRMADGLKNNPFLLADKKKVKKAPSAPPPPKRRMSEPHPILPLSETQRAALMSKRKSLTSRAPMPTFSPDSPEVHAYGHTRARSHSPTRDCCGPSGLMADSASAADKANKGLLGPDLAGKVTLHRENFEW